jgi:hypothetical protein
MTKLIHRLLVICSLAGLPVQQAVYAQEAAEEKSHDQEATPVQSEENQPVQESEDGLIRIPGAVIGRMGDPVAVDPDTYQFSDAERKLWLEDHLDNITSPVRLLYSFSKAGSFEDGFSDTVRLDVVAINSDGTRDTELEFLTGERAYRGNPDNTKRATGNPVLGVYLQGDIIDMSQRTGGNWRHFQRRIKLALANSAEIEPVQIEYNGQVLPGEKISIRPYEQDPRRNLYMNFAGKRYEFILSDQIPGTIYQIKTIVPDASKPEAAPLVEEALTLKSVEMSPR